MSAVSAGGWRYHNPVDVRFGHGVLDSLGRVVGGRAYALVTYGDAPFAPMAARIAERAGAAAAVIDDVRPNPDFTYLAGACARFAAAATPPQVIVALGGGSAMDTAKVLAAADGDFARVRRYLETGAGESALAAIPVVAVPTTAGTGSEVTSWATLWDRDNGRKHSLARDSLYPSHALVDPDLTLGLPRGLTVQTGLDALSHALESLWNHNANPVSTRFAVAAARDILATLPRLAADLDNRDLRRAMAWAALQAGLAFSNTRTALAHNISYPVTLGHGVAHGLAASFTLPRILRAVAGADADCDAALREIFGRDLAAGADRLSALLAGLGVSEDPAAYGVGPEVFEAMVDAAFAGARGRNFIGTPDRFAAAGRRDPDAGDPGPEDADAFA
ncbi:MAG: phosphonoacetaldehyde reductase [Hyphomicrobiales bacterium]|nr:phosphonoacetaldehyde reductase [Hyphomicrobiales bacterium]